jgi:hypothetical protein
MATFRNKKLYNEAAGAKPNESYKKGLARKLAMGTPVIASASGVKGGRGANRAFGALTGITAGKKGIQVDPVGVALSLSGTGAVGKVLRGAIPAATRIAGAAARVSRRARLASGAAGRAASNAGWEMETAQSMVNAGRKMQDPIGGNANRYDFRGHGAFDESLGHTLSNMEHGIGISEGERLVREGRAVKEYVGGGFDRWVYKLTGGKQLMQEGESLAEAAYKRKLQFERAGQKADELATTGAAAREIRRRLAALRSARRGR